ncbi:hypothetical protein A7K93_04935 [Candidatus Methylacidiphilum fumarolicum]|uniref:Uncharacterized protein n=2 Tax=Candidatus Methylacidiphilum fumarolicum TaxID=591154 RepID=I0JZJ2_METFB|nr:hypothetical protein A7K73_06935 [Candidatus Methylacidiphilum fumarolicum]CCG92661.1 hypothetical protein MFUM_720027 [Methylacidiphilum fumariolicum SolV]TFE74039.1 hypothetical protein A7K93_04935 [Candidatus Methylacidiphilum fumarolicum]TFE74147.1 hypothetical protein A7D33_02085 [Candidatus Methylacidiphilum fumarolicum]TFE74934.1 hypothetical protein A7K72_02860 [Candidatus Methylacidiphilum fumarolicum]
MLPDKTMWRTIPSGEPATQPEKARDAIGSLAFAKQPRMSVFSSLYQAWTASWKVSRERGEQGKLMTESDVSSNRSPVRMWKVPLDDS